LVFLLFAGCASAPHLQAAHLAPAIREHPERLILVTVANPSIPVESRAGSTTHGYAGFTAYGVAASARTTAAELAKDYSLEQVGAWPISQLHVHCVVFAIPEDRSRGEVLDRLMHDARVKLAEPMRTYDTLSSYNDPYVELQHGLIDLDVADAHAISQGEGIRVAIIDTGIALEHPDLKGRILAAKNFVDNDDVQFAHDRHGTQVAGVIAAVANNHEGIVGVAPAVKIIAIKACWQLPTQADAARCNSFTLAQALSAALQASAQIVNLSLTGPADPLLNELIREGVRQGTVFVGAAPNTSGANDFPAGAAGVLGVDAAENTSERVSERLYAPGRDILTLTPEGHYDFASGSSFATAHVTGTVALLLARNAKLTATAIHTLLTESEGQMSTQAGSKTSINACAALAAMAQHGPCKLGAQAAERTEASVPRRM
jgi:hypothetical protein